jgi:methionine sulfoxide reductase heme-binding subunit
MKRLTLQSLTDRANLALRRLPVWLVYCVGVLPAPWFFYLGLTGGLGVEPIKALEHKYGELALQLVVAALAVSPFRKFTGLNLLRFRRAIGLLSFFFVCCHLLVWLILDVQDLGRIWADIVKRPYITVGMAGFLFMIPLAVTSNDLSVRRLGPSWKQVQKLVFVVSVLGALHFVMLAKGFQLEPLLYMAIILALLTLRLLPRRLRGGKSARSVDG